MSRTYSNFLLFEDVLDTLASSTGIMSQAVRLLLNPMATVVMEDCSTYLGSIVDTSFELEGLTYITTGDVLTHQSISDLLRAGKYKVGVRDLSTCVAHQAGGICRKCYEGTLIGSTAPAVGSTVTIPSMLIYQTDVLVGDGYTATFDLTETSDDWYDVKVINNGVIQDSSTYTLDYDTITLNTAPSSGNVYVVHYLKQNSDPFLGYIAKTYSGALLGMQPLPTIKPMLREALYEALFSDNYLGLLVEELKPLKAIPSTYMDYLEQIHGRMEKVLLTLYLYALYSNVQV